MPVLLSPEDSRRLRAYFEDAGYEETQIRKQLGAPELPARHLRNEPRLLDRTSDRSLLNVLLRWFWLGRAQTEAEVADLVPSSFLGMLLQSGLIRAEGSVFTPAAMFLCTNKFLIAADHPSAILRGDADLVLWPNPTSKFLARFTISRHSRATLDLGTGSGILSLCAAPFSDRVVATDLNERAVSFAQFNARVNGMENIEVLSGDCFAPVEGRRFDLILSNPPFFITPKQDYMFCENSMELDGLCRRLVKEAPDHLNEGGYLEMLCEWAQIKDQPWEERIAEWLHGSHCDAWVMKGLTQDPSEYAQHRIRETMPNPENDARLYDGYMTYYRERGVEAIHGGLVVMRRRSGINWARIEEVPTNPSGNLGELILNTFAAQDWSLQMEDDATLLAIKPKLSPHVRLEQVCEQVGGRWVPKTITMRLTSGFAFQNVLQPFVAEFLATCDGTRTSKEVIDVLAAAANAPSEIVMTECLAMIRKFVERGFMVVAND
jgi:SAM-dependent methyltransferase